MSRVVRSFTVAARKPVATRKPLLSRDREGAFLARLSGALVLAVPAFAQESGGAAEKPSMVIWQILNFLILAGIIGWLVKKHGSPALVARSKGITEGLAAGEKAKAEADARAREVQAKLANLDQEIAGLRTDARAMGGRSARFGRSWVGGGRNRRADGRTSYRLRVVG